MRWKNRSYLKVRRWVDQDLLAYPRRPISLMGPLFVAPLAFAAASFFGMLTVVVFYTLVAPGLALWTTFVLWRAGRIMRAAAIRGDRQFDQRGKYLLPPEYAASESATAAGRRRRNSRR